jgi:hypothetical protein
MEMATQAAVEEEFPLGTRVVDADGFKATVVYVGPVATAKNPEDVWLGNAAGKEMRWENAREQHGGFVGFDERVRVACSVGMRAGVIWDNPSRGKHDGSVVDNEVVLHTLTALSCRMRIVIHASHA